MDVELRCFYFILLSSYLFKILDGIYILQVF